MDWFPGEASLFSEEKQGRRLEREDWERCVWLGYKMNKLVGKRKEKRLEKSLIQNKGASEDSNLKPTSPPCGEIAECQPAKLLGKIYLCLRIQILFNDATLEQCQIIGYVFYFVVWKIKIHTCFNTPYN